MAKHLPEFENYKAPTEPVCENGLWYDFTTTRKTFIEVHEELVKRGVKNNKFFLSVTDPKLIGVDPHDEKNLSMEMKARIYKECLVNRWYFTREVCRVVAPGAPKGIPYMLNLGNLAIVYVKSLNMNQISLLPRQTGKTIAAIIDDVWVFYFGATYSNISYGNKSFSDSKNNLKRFRDLRELLPKYIQALITDSKDTNNQEKVTTALRNNEIAARPAPTSEEQADKLGRGLTTSLLTLDEIAFLKFNDIVYTALAPAWFN